MTERIIRRFSGESGKGRKKLGALFSVLGMLLNLMLFALKYTAGTLSGSIAITADSFNNLADAGSCILALSGFLLGNMKPSRRFPFGCGRLEYLSGLLISLAVLGIGCRMLLSSIGKLLHPQEVDGCPTVIMILLISVGVKGFMYLYNSRIGKRIESAGMKAAAMDSLADCIATLAILTSIVIENLTGFNADGFTGMLVALCILYAGAHSVWESGAPLLGRGIDKETLDKLSGIMQSDPRVRDFSEPAIHDYGPQRRVLTIYICCDNVEAVIPLLRKRIKEELQAEAVICPIGEMNKSASRCRQYHRKKEKQERE